MDSLHLNTEEDAVAVACSDLSDACVAHVLSFMQTPRDLASAELACRAWCRVCEDSSAWLQMATCHLQGFAASSQPRLERRLVKRLCGSALARPGRGSLLAEGQAASSTDNPWEHVRNTLTTRLHTMDSYWSSAGGAPADPSWLLYRLCARVSVVHSVQARPYYAIWQDVAHAGRPLYSPLRVRVQLGARTSDIGGWSDETEAVGDDTQWSYTSEAFAVEQADVLQTFTLPQPVVCAGGMMRLLFEGRAQQQDADQLYYVCIVRARALGTPLYGYRCLANGQLHYDGVDAGRRDAVEAEPSSEEDDNGDDDDELVVLMSSDEE